MVGEPGRFCALDQGLQPAQVLSVERLRGTEIHGDPMLHDPVLVQNLVEHTERASAIDHEVFRDNLKPIDDRFLFEDMVVVRYAQPYAYPVVRVPIKTICWHGVCEGVKMEAGLAGPLDS